MAKVIFGPIPYEGRPTVHDGELLRNYHERQKGQHHASSSSQEASGMRVFTMPDHIVLVDAQGHFLCLVNAKSGDIMDAGVMRYASTNANTSVPITIKTAQTSSSHSTRLGPDSAIPLGVPFEECFFDHKMFSKNHIRSDGTEVDSDDDDDYSDDDVDMDNDDMDTDAVERKSMEKRASEEMAMQDAELVNPHSNANGKGGGGGGGGGHGGGGGFGGGRSGGGGNSIQRSWNSNVVAPINRTVVQPFRQSVVQPINRTVVQPFRQSVVQPIRRTYDQRRVLNPPSYSTRWRTPLSFSSPAWRSRYRYYAPYVPAFYAASLAFGLWYPRGRYVYLRNRHYNQYNLPMLPSIPFNAGPEMVEAELNMLRNRYALQRQQGYEIVPYFYNDDMRPGKFVWVAMQNAASFSNFQGAQVYGDDSGF